MHIITGLLLASLFGKKDKSNSLFIRYTGPIITKHHIDGRIRFEIQKLKNNQLLINELITELRKINGITSCSANAVSGSLVLHYEKEQISPDFLFSILVRLLRVEHEIEETPISIVEKEIRSLGGSLNKAVYDRSRGIIDFKTALPLALGIAGIQKIYQEGLNNSFPSGFILLWWVYQSFSKH